MARWMTPGRAALVAVLLGLVFGLGCPVRPLAERAGNPQPESRAWWNAQAQHTAAARALRTAILVDSARRAVGSAAAGPLHIAVGRDVAPAVARVVEGAVRQAWPEGPLPATVAIVLDTNWNVFRRGVELVHALPRSPDERCFTLVRLGKSIGDGTNVRSNLALDLRDYLPGPCGLVTAFGRPGPGVADWLSTTGGLFARETRWTGAVHRAAPQAFGMSDIPMIAGFGGASRALLGCLSHRQGTCAAWVRHQGTDGGVPREVRYLAMTGDVTLVTPVPVGERRYAVDRWEDRFLGDLIRARGAAAFTAFWTSEAPLDSAFAHAFGTSLDAFTADWVADSGLEAPEPMRSPWRLLPTLLVCVLAGVGGAALYTSRRTVSA